MKRETKARVLHFCRRRDEFLPSPVTRGTTCRGERRGEQLAGHRGTHTCGAGEGRCRDLEGAPRPCWGPGHSQERCLLRTASARVLSRPAVPRPQAPSEAASLRLPPAIREGIPCEEGMADSGFGTRLRLTGSVCDHTARPVALELRGTNWPKLGLHLQQGGWRGEGRAAGVYHVCINCATSPL